MQEFNGKVAVVTGAASGIGRAMATRFAAAGMKVVLGDVELEPLGRAERELAATGATVLAVRIDVGDAAAVEALAQRTIDAFGAVHIVCNNAGVIVAGRSWELTSADWEWMLRVNLWGVIHGIRAFVPRLLAQGGEAHIVNTASAAGLYTGANYAPYYVSKHGVVALSETLARELAEIDAKISVSVLCPQAFRTNLTTAERNRPMRLQDAGPAVTMTQPLREAIERGPTAESVAEEVFAAIQAERFYILPHERVKGAVRARMEAILNDGSPVPGRGGLAR